MCVSLDRQNPHLVFNTSICGLHMIRLKKLSFKVSQGKLQSREKACKRFAHCIVPCMPAVNATYNSRQAIYVQLRTAHCHKELEFNTYVHLYSSSRAKD